MTIMIRDCRPASSDDAALSTDLTMSLKSTGPVGGHLGASLNGRTLNRSISRELRAGTARTRTKSRCARSMRNGRRADAKMSGELWLTRCLVEPPCRLGDIVRRENCSQMGVTAMVVRVA